MVEEEEEEEVVEQIGNKDKEMRKENRHLLIQEEDTKEVKCLGQVEALSQADGSIVMKWGILLLNILSGNNQIEA